MYDRQKAKITYNRELEVWELRYADVDYVISYSSSYETLYNMEEMLIEAYLAEVRSISDSDIVNGFLNLVNEEG